MKPLLTSIQNRDRIFSINIFESSNLGKYRKINGMEKRNFNDNALFKVLEVLIDKLNNFQRKL